MAQHIFKNLVVAGGLAAALAAGGSGDARAFTETTLPPAQPQAVQPAPQFQLKNPEGGGDTLTLSTPGDAKSGGTELRIPGIGSVGTVPKLDFGLDLLYGAGSDPVQDRPLESDGNDVTIKGTLRHRF